MKEHIIIEFKAFWVRDLRLGVLQEFCIEASLQYVQPVLRNLGVPDFAIRGVVGSTWDEDQSFWFGFRGGFRTQSICPKPKIQYETLDLKQETLNSKP